MNWHTRSFWDDRYVFGFEFKYFERIEFGTSKSKYTKTKSGEYSRSQSRSEKSGQERDRSANQ